MLFANALPDLLEALGPQGRLTLAVERRLVPLFRRSFPQAEVGAHATYRVEHQSVRTAPFARHRTFDVWAPMASLLRRFRRGVDDFPARPAFLQADPQRVAYWRDVLGGLGDGRKVGLLWKSLKVSSQRSRFYAPFADWAPVLATPGVRFVNLQYGDCAAELAHARDVHGVEIWTPNGLDLKDDLDEVAALASRARSGDRPRQRHHQPGRRLRRALLVRLPARRLADAWDRPISLVSGRARVFSPPGFNRWAPAMADLAVALRQDVSVTA